MKKINTREPRNECITVMVSASEKDQLQRRCDELESSLSVEGRISMILRLINDSEWKLVQEISVLKGDSTDWKAIAEKHFHRMLKHRNNYIAMIDHCDSNGIVLPKEFPRFGKNRKNSS